MTTRAKLVVFMTALIFRLFVGWASFATPAVATTNDSSYYRELASDLAAGSFPSIFRTPGYPLFLLATGAQGDGSTAPCLLVQMLLDSVAAVMVGRIAYELLGSAPAGLLGGLSWAFCPVAAAMSGMVMSETLFTFLVISALYCAVLWRGWVNVCAQVILWGAAALTRPSGILLPLIVTGFVSVHSGLPRLRRVREQLLVGLLYAAFVGGWILYNYHRVGLAVISTVPQHGLYAYELSCVRMVDEVRWPSYVRLWLIDPREAEKVRSQYEVGFIREMNLRDQSGKRVANLWVTTEDPAQVRRLYAEAKSRLAGRWPALVGLHLVGVLQTLRPIPPWRLGGWPASVFDMARLLFVLIALSLLVRKRQWWLVSFVIVWSAYTLLLPGPCGVFRFRSGAEPAFSLALAGAFVSWLQSVQRWWGLTCRVRSPDAATAIKVI